MKENITIASELISVAKEILAADYVYNPDHKKKPRGGNWHKTDKVWSNVEKGKSTPNTRSETSDDGMDILHNPTEFTRGDIKSYVGFLKKKVGDVKDKIKSRYFTDIYVEDVGSDPSAIVLAPSDDDSDVFNMISLYHEGDGWQWNMSKYDEGFPSDIVTSGDFDSFDEMLEDLSGTMDKLDEVSLKK